MNSAPATPKQQLAIAVVTFSLAAVLIGGQVLFARRTSNLTAPQSAHFTSRPQFDAALDKCLTGFKSRDPFDISVMVVKEGRDLEDNFRRDDWPQEHNLKWPALRNRVEAWLHTPKTSAVSVFIRTHNGSHTRPDAVVTWGKNGGLIQQFDPQTFEDDEPEAD